MQFYALCRGATHWKKMENEERRCSAHTLPFKANLYPHTNIDEQSIHIRYDNSPSIRYTSVYQMHIYDKQNSINYNFHKCICVYVCCAISDAFSTNDFHFFFFFVFFWCFAEYLINTVCIVCLYSDFMCALLDMRFISLFFCVIIHTIFDHIVCRQPSLSLTLTPTLTLTLSLSLSRFSFAFYTYGMVRVRVTIKPMYESKLNPFAMVFSFVSRRFIQYMLFVRTE